MTTTISLPLLPSQCTGTNGIGILQSYELQMKIQRMIARRQIPANNNCNHPTPNHIYLQRNVTGITFSLSSSTAVITVDGADFCGGTDDVSGITYADGFGCVVAHSPDTDWIATSWTFVFDHPLFAWSRNIKCDVQSWTNTRTITVDAGPIRDAIKSCIIPSAGYLIGFGAQVIKRGGRSRADRVQQFPNDLQLVTGTVVSLPANTNVTPALPLSPAANILRDPKTNWLNANGRDLRGCELRYITADGRIQSAVIAPSSRAEIAFLSGATDVASVGTPWVVGTAGARLIPGRPPQWPWFANRGAGEFFDTFDYQVNDVSQVFLPVSKIKEPTMVSSECQDLLVPAWGVDLITSPDGQEDPPSYQVCNRPYDHHYMPDFWMGWAGKQFGVLNLCQSYYEKKDWSSSKGIPPFNPVECARVAAGILAAAATNTGAANLPQTIRVHVATTGNVEGSSGNDGTLNSQIAITGSSFTHYPVNCFYSIDAADGSYHWGYGLMPDANTLQTTNSTAFFQQDDRFTPSIPGDNGRTIRLWAGFMKPVFDQFRSLYDQPGTFRSDVVTPDVGAPFAQYPPSPVNYTNSATFGMGSFVRTPKSDHCWDWNDYNADPLAVQGFAVEGGYSNTVFVTNRVYRHVGDTMWHPAIRDGDFLQGSPLSPHLAKRWIGKLSNATQGQRMALMSGSVSASGSSWCCVPTCDFFNDPFTGGVIHTASGTATSGSLTSLTDSTFASSSNGISSLALSRFPGFGGSYVSFGIEVNFGTNPASFDLQATECRLINTGGTSGTFTYDAMSTSPAGKSWRIRETSFLHPVFGRTMTFSPGSNAGTAFQVTNIGTCGPFQFFKGAGTNLSGPGWEMRIDYPLPGPVYKYNGTTSASPFTIATGSDTARLGVFTARPFLAASTYNLEGIRIDNGIFCQNTIVCPEIVNELWAFLMAMERVLTGMSWTNMSSDTDTSPAVNDIEVDINYRGELDGKDPHDVQNIDETTGADTGPWSDPDGNDIYAKAHIKWGDPSVGVRSSAVGDVPRSNTFYTTGSDGAFLDTTAVQSWAKAFLPGACRDVQSASLSCYIFCEIDSLGTDPRTGACPGGLPADPTPIGFSAAHTPALHRLWSLAATGSATGTNAAYVGPVGNLTFPEETPITVCFDTVATPGIWTGGGFGGWYATDSLMFCDYTFNDD